LNTQVHTANTAEAAFPSCHTNTLPVLRAERKHCLSVFLLDSREAVHCVIFEGQFGTGIRHVSAQKCFVHNCPVLDSNKDLPIYCW